VLGIAQLLRQLDSFVVDSAIVGVGRSTETFSQVLKTAVSGNAQHYGLFMAAGVLALIVLAILVQ
jgi:ABC-type glycerol-3-phosphate transport system permease component